MSPDLVDGRWTDGAGGHLTDVLDPADQRVAVARVPAMTAAGIEDAYSSVAGAVRAWWHGGGLARAAVLTRAADVLRQRAEESPSTSCARWTRPSPRPGANGQGSRLLDFYAGLGRLPGSTEIGMGLRVTLADTDVRLQTELGGKIATAVLADADLDLAACTVAAAAFGQVGRRCTATSRLVAAVGNLRVAPAWT